MKQWTYVQLKFLVTYVNCGSFPKKAALLKACLLLHYEAT